MSTFLDVLVAGIGGAAGRGADIIQEEITLLRKHSLAQMREQSGTKGSLRAIDADALGIVDFMLQNEMIDEPTHEVLSSDPDLALRFVRNPANSSKMKAVEEALTEESRQTTGAHQLAGQGEAIRNISRMIAEGSDQQDVAAQIHASLQAQGRDVPDYDFTDPRQAAAFMNTPQAQSMLEVATDAETLFQRNQFNIPQAEGRDRASRDVGEVTTGLLVNLPGLEGTASGQRKVAEHEVMLEGGIRSSDIDDAAPVSELIEDFIGQAIDPSAPFWDQETPASRAGREVVNAYAIDRATELLESGMPPNEIRNTMIREANRLRRMNLEEEFRGMVNVGREAADTQAEFDRSNIDTLVGRIRQELQGPEAPRAELPPLLRRDPDVTTAPVIEGDDTPQILQRDEAPVEPAGPTASVTEEGRLELSPALHGNKTERLDTVRQLIRQAAESDDIQVRSQKIQQAQRILAQHTTAADRNGKSPQDYIRVLITEMMTGA